MPFYLRKSITAGPFRFNLSKSGVGLSVGVKGLRIGTGPKGHYIHAGVGGLYYRSFLSRAGEKSKSNGLASHSSDEQPTVGHTQEDVVMEDIESGSVLAMKNSNYVQVLDELNSNAGKMKFSSSFFLTSFSIVFLLNLLMNWAYLLYFLISIVLYFIGAKLDEYKRTSVLFYDLDETIQNHTEKLNHAIDRLKSSNRIWHIASKGSINDLKNWKRNAGASQLVSRHPTAISYKLPSHIKSNFIPAAFAVGKQTLYFFPDMILVFESGKLGSIAYENLHVERETSRFIEEGAVPSDSQVLGYTWAHPNKSGGPDRRFANNREIPVCLYEYVHFTSKSGLNELISTSKPSSGEELITTLKHLPNGLRSKSKVSPV
jgi:Protein of unknown function (DUF4236)